MEAKAVSASRAEFTHLVLPPDTNALGTIFGGRIMEWVDIAAAIVSQRHCRTTAVTASIDELHFIHPVRLGDIVILKVSVNYVHKSSMEIGVSVEAEDPRSGLRRQTSSAFLTFVALDEAGKPTPVPPLILETQEDQKRFEAGRIRMERRKQQRLKRQKKG
ncbi:MAG: acyl-CoA thioesterase [Deltaproteobacteria bacterium]|nr:acyl-CoA thioesterase [Deltaproteobacteria bacterium]